LAEKAKVKHTLEASIPAMKNESDMQSKRTFHTGLSHGGARTVMAARSWVNGEWEPAAATEESKAPEKQEICKKNKSKLDA
jgi:poly(3-hydroxybutyrate) depolymerase